MNPDGSGCNIQIVNATGLDMVIGTSPTTAAQNFGSYQMAAWFPGLGFGSVLAPAGSTASAFAQALRGGGDEDDSANCPVNMANASDPGWSLFQWFASSASNSAHFMYIVGSPGSKLPAKYLALGIAQGTFETTPPAQVQWQQLGTETIQLGFPPTLSVILVDLELVYDPVTAKNVYDNMGAATLSQGQSADLYAQVIGFSYPNLTTLAFELTNVSFPNPPTPSTTSKSLIGNDVISVPNSVTVSREVSFEQQFENSVSLSSSTTWAIGVEVKASLPLPMSPSAKLTGSFQYTGQETSDTDVTTTVNLTETVTVQGPGQFQVVGVVEFADNYAAGFIGDLTVTGTIDVPAANVSVEPLNGTVLFSLMNNPKRNQGSEAQPFTLGENNVTAAVTGTLTGSIAYSTDLTVTQQTTGG